MGFVERIFHPVIQAVERAFTPPGTGGQEAAAQQQAAATAQTAALPQVAPAPIAPNAPPSAKMFQPSAAPGAAQKIKTASSMLGTAATSSQMAGSMLGTGSSQKNKNLGA